jgi:hypothetical protein
MPAEVSTAKHSPHSASAMTELEERSGAGFAKVPPGLEAQLDEAERPREAEEILAEADRQAILLDLAREAVPGCVWAGQRLSDGAVLIDGPDGVRTVIEPPEVVAWLREHRKPSKAAARNIRRKQRAWIRRAIEVNGRQPRYMAIQSALGRPRRRANCPTPRAREEDGTASRRQRHGASSPTSSSDPGDDDPHLACAEAGCEEQPRPYSGRGRRPSYCVKHSGPTARQKRSRAEKKQATEAFGLCHPSGHTTHVGRCARCGVTVLRPSNGGKVRHDNGGAGLRTRDQSDPPPEYAPSAADFLKADGTELYAGSIADVPTRSDGLDPAAWLNNVCPPVADLLDERGNIASLNSGGEEKFAGQDTPSERAKPQYQRWTRLTLHTSEPETLNAWRDAVYDLEQAAA